MTIHNVFRSYMISVFSSQLTLGFLTVAFCAMSGCSTPRWQYVAGHEESYWVLVGQQEEAEQLRSSSEIISIIISDFINNIKQIKTEDPETRSRALEQSLVTLAPNAQGLHNILHKCFGIKLDKKVAFSMNLDIATKAVDAIASDGDAFSGKVLVITGHDNCKDEIVKAIFPDVGKKLLEQLGIQSRLANSIIYQE